MAGGLDAVLPASHKRHSSLPPHFVILSKVVVREADDNAVEGPLRP